MRADAVTALGRLALALGRVDRITYHPDGATPESVTDHTVMLSLVACALAAAHGTDLDIGLVAQYAAVHDLPEAYCGDTPTLNGLTAEEKAAKQRREQDGQDHIVRECEHHNTPWLPDLLRSYEQQHHPATRFVRAVDKLLPKITHLANGCRTLIEQGVDPDRLAVRYVAQRAEIAEYAGEWPWLLDLHADLAEQVIGLYRRSLTGTAVAP